eukprot:6183601-Prymnesium_polylepis.1
MSATNHAVKHASGCESADVGHAEWWKLAEDWATEIPKIVPRTVFSQHYRTSFRNQPTSWQWRVTLSDAHATLDWPSSTECRTLACRQEWHHRDRRHRLASKPGRA